MAKSPQTNDKNETTKKISNKQIAVIVAVIVVAVAVIVGVLLWLNREQEEPAGNLMVTDENLGTIMDDLQKNAGRGTFTTHMNTYWVFPNGSTPSSNAVIGNSTANTYPLHFVVSLAETDEVIYESGLIPVGMTVNELVLDKELPAGVYPANVTFYIDETEDDPVSYSGSDDLSNDSNLSVAVTIEVEN